jgi:hypothetical protein
MPHAPRLCRNQFIPSVLILPPASNGHQAHPRIWVWAWV